MSGYLKCMSMGWEQIFREETEGVMFVSVCVWGWVRFGLRYGANVPTSSGIIFEGVLAHSVSRLDMTWLKGEKHFFNLLCSALCKMSSVVQFLCSVKGDSVVVFLIYYAKISTDLDSQWSSCIFVCREKSSFDTLFYRKKSCMFGEIWVCMNDYRIFDLIELAKFKQNKTFFLT